jgi:hypothetical protein
MIPHNMRQAGSREIGYHGSPDERGGGFMKRLMVLIVAFVFCVTASGFAQAPAAKSQKKSMKERLLEEEQDAKKDAKEMKEGVKKEVKEQAAETKESVKEVKKAAKEDVKKVKKAASKDAPAADKK